MVCCGTRRSWQRPSPEDVQLPQHEVHDKAAALMRSAVASPSRLPRRPPDLIGRLDGPDRSYYEGDQIRACEEAGVTVTLPKPLTSGAKAAGRFGKQDFVYLAAADVYRCPAGERLTYRFTGEEDGKKIRRYWTNACRTCPLKGQCTTGPERRIARWEHEAVLERVQDRLDRNPDKMTVRRQTAEHPFGTIKTWMGATHLPRLALRSGSILGYNGHRSPRHATRP
jgi:Transposase DDE domain